MPLPRVTWPPSKDHRGARRGRIGPFRAEAVPRPEHCTDAVFKTGAGRIEGSHPLPILQGQTRHRLPRLGREDLGPIQQMLAPQERGDIDRHREPSPACVEPAPGGLPSEGPGHAPSDPTPGAPGPSLPQDRGHLPAASPGLEDRQHDPVDDCREALALKEGLLRHRVGPASTAPPDTLMASAPAKRDWKACLDLSGSGVCPRA